MCQDATAVVGCFEGSVVEVDLPEKSSQIVSTSFNLNLPQRQIKFKSVKSEIIRAREEEELQERRKSKLDRKLIELAQLKVENPNIVVDEEKFLCKLLVFVAKN